MGARAVRVWGDNCWFSALLTIGRTGYFIEIPWSCHHCHGPAFYRKPCDDHYPTGKCSQPIWLAIGFLGLRKYQVNPESNKTHSCIVRMWTAGSKRLWPTTICSIQMYWFMNRISSCIGPKFTTTSQKITCPLANEARVLHSLPGLQILDRIDEMQTLLSLVLCGLYVPWATGVGWHEVVIDQWCGW